MFPDFVEYTNMEGNRIINPIVKSTVKGWVYILLCSDNSYYTGSTNNLELRLTQHQNGEGSNHTKKKLPVTLVYFEEFQRIEDAFYREKQIQNWNRKKKEALIQLQFEKLPELSRAFRDKRID